jgi:hypothetical protein
VNLPPGSKPAVLPDPNPNGTFTSPIGVITNAENVFIHTHPIEMFRWRADAAYRAAYLGQPAMAATAKLDAQLTYWGEFCANGCINNWNTGSVGNTIRFYIYTYGSIQMQWNQWYFGGVSPTWPIANTSFYEAYHGNSVYQYCWAPNRQGSGLCLSQIDQENGAVTLENTTGGSDDQWWIWDGNSHWVAVWLTGDSYLNFAPHNWSAAACNTGNGQPLLMMDHCIAAWHAFS